MMASIKETLYRLGIDSDTKVAVLTGKDPVSRKFNSSF